MTILLYQTCEQCFNPTVIYANNFYANVTCSNKSNSSFSDPCNNFYSFIVLFCDKTVLYFLTDRCTIILRGLCSVIASFYYFETISAVSIICIHFRCRQFIKVFSSRSVPGNTKNQATNQPLKFQSHYKTIRSCNKITITRPRQDFHSHNTSRRLTLENAIL